jgi:predicted phage tail protein
MLRKIVLHGRLGKKFGREFEFDVATVAEGVRALCALVPGFVEEMAKGHYTIRVRAKSQTYFDENMLHLDIGNAHTIHITPRAEGAKSGGLGKIILGVLIIGAAIAFAPGVGIGLAAKTGTFAAGMAQAAFLGISYGTIALFGATIALSGLALMLAPTPKIGNYGDREKEPQSLMFNGPVNTREQGGAVPLVYGEMIVGSVMISAGLVAEDVEAAPSYPYISPEWGTFSQFGA